MGLFKTLFGATDKDLEEEEIDRLTDKEKVKRMWNGWTDRERETLNMEEDETTTLEIPVYKIRVEYQDGKTEVIKHESPTRPDTDEISSFHRYDLDATSYRFNESKLDLKFGDVKRQKLSTVNRDHVTKVTIIEKTGRPVELQYDVETIQITESRGSIEKRNMRSMYHPARREEYLIEELLYNYTPEELKEKNQHTVLKARNVEVLE